MSKIKKPGYLKNKNLQFEEEKNRLVWSLSVEQRKALSKINPYRRERDRLIADLRQKGVKLAILADLSKMSKTSILRAVCRAIV